MNSQGKNSDILIAFQGWVNFTTPETTLQLHFILIRHKISHTLYQIRPTMYLVM